MAETAEKPSERRTARSFDRQALVSTVMSPSPFARLARPHGFSVGGDALVAIALADSVFFSLDPNDARWRVSLYLLLTVAPFAVVAQFLGPLVDRVSGGNKIIIVGVGFGRGLMAVLMATQVESLLFFPMAFSMLVMGKAHHIAKSALVPSLIDDPSQLVRANSRLSIISAISATIAAIPGGILLLLGGAPWVLVFAGALFVVGGIIALQIPHILHHSQAESGEPGGEDAAEISGLAIRKGGILLASSAMAYVRGVTGFLTMLLAFALRGGVDAGPTGAGVEMGHRVREALGQARLDLAVGGSPTWHFGAVVAASGVGAFIGAVLSPHLRHRFSEERNLAGMLGLIAVVGVLGAFAGGLLGAMSVGFAVAMGGAVGKQSFDAIVQRDAPTADLSHTFAKFESRFQLVWVLGAILPVILPIPARIGFVLLSVTAGFAAVSYWLGRDPAPNTDVARRSAKAAGVRASRTVKERTGTMRNRRNGRRTPTDTEPAEPTAEHPGLARNLADDRRSSQDDPTRQDLPSLTDTQPIPTVRPRRADDDPFSDAPGGGR